MSEKKKIDQAIEKMKETYPWAAREYFRKEWTYAIENEGGRDVFVSYFRWSAKDIERQVFEGSEEEFVNKIISDNSDWIEDANEVEDVFKVPYGRPTDAHGWNLERYEFRSHALGGYSAFVEAGNRYTGGSRVFFIPPKYLEGTFEQFLDQYCQLVPGSAFGLFRQDLEKVEGLKSFLGFKEGSGKKVGEYIRKNAAYSEYLFTDWEEFLKIVYEEGEKVSGILFWDHCLKEKQCESLGRGGYTDKEDSDWMYAETDIYQDGFENKTLSEVKEYIRSVQKLYPDHQLVPSFYLDE